MTEKCLICNKHAAKYDGDTCLECYKRNNPPIQQCPKCGQIMVKKYRGRLHLIYPPIYHFKWVCLCGYTEPGCDGLKNHYPDELLIFLNGKRWHLLRELIKR